MTTKRIPNSDLDHDDQAEAQLRHRLVVLAICIQSAIFGAVVALGIQGCEGKAESPQPADSEPAGTSMRGGEFYRDYPAAICLVPARERVRPSAPPAPSLCRVTAYCPCRLCCGPRACGITASGTKADHRLVAGPPEIPFGTVVEVPGYGRCKVEDRGGAIRGKRLDVLFQTHAEARAWGVKWMRVRGL